MSKPPAEQLDPGTLEPGSSAQREGGGFLGARARVLLLILFAQALMVWWIADSEIDRTVYLICYSLMMPTVLLLMLARIFRKWLPFDDKEILLVYVVLTATIPIVGFGGLRFLSEGMGFLPFFSTTNLDYGKLLPFLPRLPVLHDPNAIAALYMGGKIHWSAWVAPILFWSAYLLLLSAIWISFAAILRRTWVHQERLTFPVAMLPVKLSDPKDNIFRLPVFWIGFAIPAVLQSLLALREWFPTVPAMQLKFTNIAPQVLTSPPWNAIPALNIGYYPMAIGLAYFVPSNISFSCWSLAFLMRTSYVFGAIFGLTGAGTGATRFPYHFEQSAGAWIALAGLVLWGTRRHWSTIMKTIPPDEQRTVRRAWIAALGCSAICAAMMWAVGIPMIAAVCVIAVYVAYVIAGARIRAEAGGQWTFAPLWTPHFVTNAILGVQGTSGGALVAGGHFNLIHVDIRAQSLPYLMEGMYIAEKAGISWRTILRLVAIGSVTALALGWWSSLSVMHSLGVATAKADAYPLAKASISFGEVNRLITTSPPTDVLGVKVMAIAAAVTVALAWINKFGSFPLHPIGYAVSNSLIMSAFIVPFFIAWLAKVIVLHWGGSGLYKRSVPLFVGLILGDIITQAFWTLVGRAFNLPVYQFLT